MYHSSDTGSGVIIAVAALQRQQRQHYNSGSGGSIIMALSLQLQAGHITCIKNLNLCKELLQIKFLMSSSKSLILYISISLHYDATVSIAGAAAMMLPPPLPLLRCISRCCNDDASAAAAAMMPPPLSLLLWDRDAQRNIQSGVCSSRNKAFLKRNLEKHFIFENVLIVILLSAQRTMIVPNVGVFLGMDQQHESDKIFNYLMNTYNST